MNVLNVGNYQMAFLELQKEALGDMLTFLCRFADVKRLLTKNHCGISNGTFSIHFIVFC